MIVPAGYVDMGSAVVHVAVIRKFTADVERFVEMLPHARRLDGISPGTVEAEDVWQELDREGVDAEGLCDVLGEAAKLQAALAAALRDGSIETWEPRVLFRVRR